ncbi:glycosyltransferase [Shewanella putrefaciens]|uniref:glycosyltransferase n=1 Tax=Shewanella putrefaciens TaxID=24 RepID=UPI0021C17171|nr:glycosyltransferase [Shewanella putrefaciens]UXK09900.1 glycosyltransferase [Shewanella putrefaciens]
MSLYKNDLFEHVKIAVNSILEQTYKTDLFLYCDGPLNDDVIAYLTRLDLEPNVFIYKSDVNNGLAYALNFLIDTVLIEGYRYIARMDSDDISHPSRIFNQVKHLEINPHIDVLGTSCKEFGADFALEIKSLPKNHDELYKFSVVRCPFIHPTVIFRSKVFNDGHRYPTTTLLTEDMALWHRLLLSGYKFENLDLVLLEYRINSNTLYRRKGIKKFASELKTRYSFMIQSNQFTLELLFILILKCSISLTPSFLTKVLYKYFR